MKREQFLIEKYGDRMTLKEVAGELRWSHKYAQNAVSAGLLPIRSYRLGKTRFVDTEDFAAWVDRQKKLEGRT